MKLRLTNLRLELLPVVDTILEKVLAFNPSERYPKARDFGDAFFNALTTLSPWVKNKETDEIEIITGESKAKQTNVSESATIFFIQNAEKETSEIETLPTISDIHISARVTIEDEYLGISNVKATEDLAWEKRSPKSLKVASLSPTWLAILGLAVLFGGIWAMWHYVLNRPAEQYLFNRPQKQRISPIRCRKISRRYSKKFRLCRTRLFIRQHCLFSKQKRKLERRNRKNFLGFSLYYPKDWKQNDAKGECIDVSISTSIGVPLEQADWLSPDVKNVDDMGVKGELSTILETFEPNRNF